MRRIIFFNIGSIKLESNRIYRLDANNFDNLYRKVYNKTLYLFLFELNNEKISENTDTSLSVFNFFSISTSELSYTYEILRLFKIRKLHNYTTFK